jgi:alkyl hydroperoxide reductase subunit D
MSTIPQNETLLGLADMLKTAPDAFSNEINLIAKTNHRYLKDLKINLSNALSYSNLTKKESYLLAISVAVNEKSSSLKNIFTLLAKEEGATDDEIAETYACVSLLNANNVFYRFRHFTKKEFYETTPAGIKMSIMMNPVLGKEFFELMSLAVSALNGCELCVNSHEASLTALGSSQARIYDAVRLAAIVKSVAVIY